MSSGDHIETDRQVKMLAHAGGGDPLCDTCGETLRGKNNRIVLTADGHGYHPWCDPLLEPETLDLWP